MVPATDNIVVTRGDFFSRFIRLRPKNPDGSYAPYEPLTGWTGKAQIRETPDSAQPLATMTVGLADQAAYPGGVLITMSSAMTATLDFAQPAGGVILFEKIIGFWDVQLTNTLGEPNTYLQGTVTLRKDVTK